MSLKDIKNPIIREMILSIIPDFSSIKSVGIKRVLVNENKNCFSFLFRNKGENRGVSFRFDISSNRYTIDFYELDEDQLFIESEIRCYKNLELSDLLPTFQNETGLLI